MYLKPGTQVISNWDNLGMNAAADFCSFLSSFSTGNTVLLGYTVHKIFLRMTC